MGHGSMYCWQRS